MLEDATAQDGDPVAERQRLGLVMGDVHRRDAQLPGERGYLGAQVVAELGVEVGERLVHQEGGRVAGDRTAHRHALALAARQLMGETVEEVLDAEHPGGGVDTRTRVLAGGLDA